MKTIWRYRFRITSLEFVFCVAFLMGVGLARANFHTLSGWWCGLLLIGSVLAMPKRSIWCLVLVGLLGAGIGSLRGAVYMTKLAQYQQLYGHKVVISGMAANDAVYGKNSQLSFDANTVRGPDGQPLAGKVQISGFGLSAVYQGDEVQASGTLRPGLGQYQARISFARLQLRGRNPSLIAQVRRDFAAGMQSALPEPLASFAMGLLIGQRATLPTTIKQDLLMVGLTHIIAVSGYNLTIILRASKRVLRNRSKRLATLLSFGLIAIFLLLAGSSASIVRAAIISMLSIVTGYYGRSFTPLNLILLAASLTAWANPFYVWSDTSWYLSFLAFYGVMIVAPRLGRRLRPRWRDSLLVTIALESLCAEILTLPFILHTFGQMSLVGLVANVLITTLVPLAMLCSVVAGLAGMWIGAVAGWLAWPARIVLTYMLDLARILSRIPGVFLQNLSFSLAQMLWAYGGIFAISWLLWSKTKVMRHAKITDRKLMVAEE